MDNRAPRPLKRDDVTSTQPTRLPARRSSAAAYVSGACLALVIKTGADVDGFGDMSETPLHIAVTMENVDAISLLLRNGANPDAVSEFNETPRMMAARTGNCSASALNLKTRAHLPARPNRAWRPIASPLSSNRSAKYPLGGST